MSRLSAKLTELSEAVGKLVESENPEEDRFVRTVIDKLKALVSDIRPEVEEWAEEEGYGYWDPEESLAPHGATESMLRRQFSRGFSVADAFRFHTASEDIDPRLSEVEGLRIMDAIDRKYPVKEQNVHVPAVGVKPDAGRGRY